MQLQLSSTPGKYCWGFNLYSESHDKESRPIVNKIDWPHCFINKGGAYPSDPSLRGAGAA